MSTGNQTDGLLFIRGGTDELNLLDPDGAHVMGWVPGFPRLKGGGLYTDAALADGRQLIVASMDNVVEELPIYVQGGEVAQIGDWQRLYLELCAALRNHFLNPDRFSDPVYMGYRERGQSRIQYGLLHNYDIRPRREAFSHELKGQHGKKATWVATLLLEREPAWRSYAPGTLPPSLNIQQANSPDLTPEEFINNVRETAALTHIYIFDSSLGTFSSNQILSTNFKYFPDPAGDEDILYIGSTTGRFRNIVFWIDNFRTGTATLVWERWDGAAWNNLTPNNNEIEDGTNLMAGPGADGPYALKIVNVDNDWDPTTINGVNAYWIRLRIDAFTSMPVVPSQGNFVLFNAREPRLNAPAGTEVVVHGDVDALLYLYLTNRSPAGTGQFERGIYGFIAGAKSRGLTNFYSHLNWGNLGNPTGWTASTLSGDTTLVASADAPGGQRMGCTFATDTTLVQRGRLRNQTATICSDYAGTYRVYLRCNQSTGAVGDVQVQLRVATDGYTSSTAGSYWQSKIKRLRRVLPASDSSTEVVDFGLLTLPLVRNSRGLVASQTALIGEIDIVIFASGPATAGVHFHDIVLIPVDERVMAAEAPNLAGAFDLSLVQNNAVILDSGVLGVDAQQQSDYLTNRVNVHWYLTAAPPTVPPLRTLAWYWLFFSQSSGEARLSNIGQGVFVSFYIHERWLGFRSGG